MTRTTTVNPYIFIPLSKKGPTRKVRQLNKPSEGDELLTGSIDCTLKAKTPIAIPDKRESDNDPYPFYNVDDVPTIPGSSIRGVIRNLYEILTDSCMQVNDDYFHGRTSKPKDHAGILRYNKDTNHFECCEATRYRVEGSPGRFVLPDGATTGSYAKARKVNTEKKGTGLVSFSTNSERLGDDINGYLLRSQKLDKQESWNFFASSKKSKWVSIPQKYIDAFAVNIDLYDLEESTPIDGKRKHNEAGSQYAAAFKKLKADSEARLPVWYEKAGERNSEYYFAPSQISRSVFTKKVSDFLEEAELNRCSNENDCCLACDLFGFVNGTSAKASRIRFEDANCTSGDKPYLEKLPPLMTPSSSSFEFYLQNNKSPHKFAFNSEGVELSGRKLYWHHSPEDGTTKSRPVKPGEDARFVNEFELMPENSVFEFRVFFDNITKTQLNNLVYTLTIGSAWDDDPQGKCLCHKIGHGKPAWLGSALIECEKVTIRSFNNDSYELDTNDQWKEDLGVIEKRLTKNLPLIKRVLDLNAAKDKYLDYPRAETDGADGILKWFSQNRNEGKFSDSFENTYNEILCSDGVPGYWHKGDERVKPEDSSTGTGVTNKDWQGKTIRSLEEYCDLLLYYADEVAMNACFLYQAKFQEWVKSQGIIATKESMGLEGKVIKELQKQCGDKIKYEKNGNITVFGSENY